MTKNPLLIFSLAVLFGYWLIGALIPGQVLSTLVSLLLFSVGFVTMLRYLGPAWRIVVHGDRFPDIVGQGRGGEGSFLAAYGTFLFAVGSVWAGVFTVAWIAIGDRSLDWLSTPFSMFGRFTTAIGFGLMLFSPEVTADGLRVSRTLWISATVAVVVGAVAWYFGFHMGREEIKASASYTIGTTCPAGSPIKGNESGRDRIYHIPGGRSYAATYPEVCFRTEGEARVAGYRAAR